MPRIRALFSRVFSEPDYCPRTIPDHLITRHFAGRGWIYAVAIGAFVAWQFQPTTTALYASGLLAAFVIPLVRYRPVAVLQEVLRTGIVLLLISVNLFSIPSSLMEVFDRSAGERHDAVPFSTALDSDKFFIISLVAPFIAAIPMVTIRRLRLSRMRMALIALMASCAALGLTYSSNLVRSRHDSGGPLSGLGADIAEYLAAMTILWAVSAASIIARSVPAQIPPWIPTSEGSSKEYIKAASALATTALIIAFFGVNTCWDYAAHLDRFIDVREAFAADLVAKAILDTPELKTALTDRQTSPGTGPTSTEQQVDADFRVLQKRLPRLNNVTPRPVWLQNANLQSIDFSFSGSFVPLPPRGLAFSVKITEADHPGTWQANPVLEFPADLALTHTVQLAGNCGVQLEDEATYDKVYRACEKAVLERGVKFPLIDVEFSIQYIILVAFVAICGCLVLLSDRIQRALETQVAQDSEAWIIVDATTGAGRVFANAWVFALCATPWLLVGLATAICALQIRVDGSVSESKSDGITAALMIAGAGLSAVLSCSLLRRVALLRFSRKCRPFSAPMGQKP